jgi:predicted Fe-S protein YdhL (DUF1289 family)
MTQPTINTPCTGVCTMADNGLCMGCFRSLDEITHWLAFSQEQREFIVGQLESRMEAMIA